MRATTPLYITCGASPGPPASSGFAVRGAPSTKVRVGLVPLAFLASGPIRAPRHSSPAFAGRFSRLAVSNGKQPDLGNGRGSARAVSRVRHSLEEKPMSYHLPRPASSGFALSDASRPAAPFVFVPRPVILRAAFAGKGCTLGGCCGVPVRPNRQDSFFVGENGVLGCRDCDLAGWASCRRVRDREPGGKKRPPGGRDSNPAAMWYHPKGRETDEAAKGRHPGGSGSRPGRREADPEGPGRRERRRNRPPWGS